MALKLRRAIPFGVATLVMLGPVQAGVASEATTTATVAAAVKPAPKPKLPRSLYDQAGGAIAFAPTGRSSWTARLVIKSRSRLGPSSRAALGPIIFADAPYAKLPQVFLVQSAQRDAQGTVWYKVLLPSRPNGRTAWLPERVLQVKRTPWRIRVSLANRRAQLLRNGRVQNTWRVAVGKPAYPTPVGRFAVSEIVRQPQPSGFYGPYIITLTAHSNRLNDFDGGDGRVALHGTSRPWLLGTRASHGCIRLPNAAADAIARTVPPGTPVDIS